jgi:hypothetical protein
MGTSTSGLLASVWESVTSISLDILIVLVSFALLVLYTFYFGKGRIIVLILALYVSALLYVFFPYLDSISFFSDLPTSVAWSKMLIFAGFVVVSALVMGRLIGAEFSISTLYGWFETLLLSSLAVVLLLVLSYHLLPVSEIYDFGAYLDKLFEPVEYLFWWLVLPLLGLILVSRE